MYHHNCSMLASTPLLINMWMTSGYQAFHTSSGANGEERNGFMGSCVGWTESSSYTHTQLLGISCGSRHICVSYYSYVSFGSFLQTLDSYKTDGSLTAMVVDILPPRSPVYSHPFIAAAAAAPRKRRAHTWRTTRRDPEDYNNISHTWHGDWLLHWPRKSLPW